MKYECLNAKTGPSDQGTTTLTGKMEFTLPEEERVLPVYPNYEWDAVTTCSISEPVSHRLSSSVEPNGEDCQDLELKLGKGNSCIFVNTRLYEGIPTLSRGGMMVFITLIALIGFVAGRRLI